MMKKYRSGKISLLTGFILFSLSLSLLIFFLIKIHTVSDNNLSGYIAVVGILPTAYLWIIKERKKEIELDNRRLELQQIKISELNKVYSDSVNQLINPHSKIAGIYAMIGLINDWIIIKKIIHLMLKQR